MPNRDGTGPRETGPMTGKGLGNCEPQQFVEQKGALAPFAIRRGFGFGFNRGRRCGRFAKRANWLSRFRQRRAPL